MELPTVSNRATSTEHLAGSTPCLIKEKAQVGWLKDGLIPRIERYESLWSEYQYEQEEYYSWEVNDELSDEEWFSAMLDLYDMDEILEILDDSTEFLQVLKITNLEG